MFEFNIEQVAVAVLDIEDAVRQYRRAGFKNWVEDLVVLDVINRSKRGYEEVRGTSVAALAFSYDVIPGKEFELIQFKTGDSFHDALLTKPAMSHMGLHVDSIAVWINNSPFRGIKQLMEARTLSHTSAPVVESGKRYKYVILDTLETLGFYLKLIERIMPS